MPLVLGEQVTSVSRSAVLLQKWALHGKERAYNADP